MIRSVTYVPYWEVTGFCAESVSNLLRLMAGCNDPVNPFGDPFMTPGDLDPDTEEALDLVVYDRPQAEEVVRLMDGGFLDGDTPVFLQLGPSMTLPLRSESDGGYGLRHFLRDTEKEPITDIYAVVAAVLCRLKSVSEVTGVQRLTAKTLLYASFYGGPFPSLRPA